MKPMSKYEFVPGLVETIPHRLLLTGTPVENRPREAFGLLRALDPGQFNDFFRYGLRYCDGQKEDAGRRQVWVFNGLSNAAELRERIKPLMIRREKSQVLKDLPPKRRVTIEVELSNAAEYERAARGE